ncbi:MAG: methyltransferase, partial [Prevotella sp.]|nr:methyltransferase [Prevotella sp.]
DQKRTLARHADTLPFSDLFRSVSKLLTTDGVFSAIIPTEQIKGFMAESYLNALYPVRIIHVKTTPPKQPKRCLLAFSPQPPHSIDEQTINLLTPTGERSDWYQEVTKDFYL